MLIRIGKSGNSGLSLHIPLRHYKLRLSEQSLSESHCIPWHLLIDFEISTNPEPKSRLKYWVEALHTEPVLETRELDNVRFKQNLLSWHTKPVWHSWSKWHAIYSQRFTDNLFSNRLGGFLMSATVMLQFPSFISLLAEHIPSTSALFSLSDFKHI